MESQHVLVLGAGGNVSRHSVPKLVAAGHSVSALVRNPDHVQQLVDDGATAIVRDLTTLDEEDWARLLTPFDVVVWSAGAGGGSLGACPSCILCSHRRHALDVEKTTLACAKAPGSRACPQHGTRPTRRGAPALRRTWHGGLAISVPPLRTATQARRGTAARAAWV